MFQSGTRRGAAAVLALFLLAAAMPAAAVTPKFRKEFVAAKALYDEGRYEEALAGFERALALEEAPEALYSIARCYERLANRDEAISHYAAFLEKAPKHRGVPKARRFLTSLLTAAARDAAADPEAPDWDGALLHVARALAVHAGTDPSLTDAVAAGLFVLQAEALNALDRRDEAVASYGRALGAEISLSERRELEARLAELVRPVEVTPASAPVAPASLPTSLPATMPASIPAFEPTSAPMVDVGPETAPTGARPTLASELPPPARHRKTGLWIGIGAGAGAVAIALTTTLVVVLKRPGVDGGYYRVDFRP